MSYKIGKITMKDYTERKYEYIGEFHEGLAVVKDQNCLYGYINTEGIEVISCQFRFADDFSEGLALMSLAYEKYQFIDHTGNVKLDCSHYKKVRSFHDGRAVVRKWDGSCGYINKDGVEVIPCKFNDAWDFSEGLANVEYHIPNCLQSMYVINTDGEIQYQLTGLYQISLINGFRNGIMPVLVHSWYSEATATEYMADAFVDKDGNLYKDEDKVKQLKTLYEAVKPSFLGQKSIDKKSLVCFCSKVTVIGTTIKLRANTREELIQQKKSLMTEIKTAIQEFEQQNGLVQSEEDTSEGPKIKKIV